MVSLTTPQNMIRQHSRWDLIETQIGKMFYNQNFPMHVSARLPSTLQLMRLTKARTRISAMEHSSVA
jgi:hypothetical protein